MILRRRADAAAELALTKLAGRRRRTLCVPGTPLRGQVTRVVDRSFVEDGARWIIDYKTADLGPAAGLRQLADHAGRYRPQLESYAALFGAKACRQRLAVFYVAMAFWCVWNTIPPDTAFSFGASLNADESGVSLHETSFLGEVMSDKKYRLVTRSDFDGSGLPVLLNELDMIDEIQVRPSQGHAGWQGGNFENDITTNLPFVPGVFWRSIITSPRPSAVPASAPTTSFILRRTIAARVVYEHFGGKNKFPPSFTEMMLAVDKSDSGNFTRQEILDPQDWVLLSYLIGFAHRPRPLPRVPGQQTTS